MKKLGFVAVVPCVLFISIFMVVSSCETDSNGDSYYISFDIGDEVSKFTLGLTEVEEHAWVSEINEQPTVDLYFFATPTVETGLTEPDNYMWFIIRNIDAGETGSYSTVDVYYGQDGIYYFDTQASVDINIYGAVGETLEGTFSATVTDGGPSIEITNGKFRTIRTADNTYAPFD